MSETARALELCGSELSALGVSACRWLFDQPVSNSGRLAARLREHARAGERAWEVELVPNPDPLLAASDAVVASADGAVLDAAARSFNLSRAIVERAIPNAWLVDPASIAAPRRRRRPKTDKIDGEALLRALLAYNRASHASVRWWSPRRPRRRTGAGFAASASR